MLELYHQPGTDIVGSFPFSQLNEATSVYPVDFAILSLILKTSARSSSSIMAKTGPFVGDDGSGPMHATWELWRRQFFVWQ